MNECITAKEFKTLSKSCAPSLPIKASTGLSLALCFCCRSAAAVVSAAAAGAAGTSGG